MQITEKDLIDAAGPRFQQVEAMLKGYGITVDYNNPQPEPATQDDSDGTSDPAGDDAGDDSVEGGTGGDDASGGADGVV